MDMKIRTKRIIDQLFDRYAPLKSCKKSFEEAFLILLNCYKNEGKVLVCGNGGSAADSEHIVGELMKSFLLKREVSVDVKQKIMTASPGDCDYIIKNLQGTLPAISLVSQSALSTAFINDVSPDMVFAQQVAGYARENDVLICLSTSGNSQNVIYAIKVAKALKVKTIGLTGAAGGSMKDLCDVLINVPADQTFMVQEYHLPVYHTLCAALESELFED